MALLRRHEEPEWERELEEIRLHHEEHHASERAAAAAEEEVVLRRDPLARLVSVATLLTLALLGLHYALVRSDANPENTIVSWVRTAGGALVEPWNDLWDAQPLGAATLIAGGVYLVAGIFVASMLHGLWMRTANRRIRRIPS